MTAKHAAQHSKKEAPAQPSIDASRGLMQSESVCVPANSQVESHAGIYLQRAHMTAFGRFIDRTLGPFKPGLNVVYGPNEAGKTTARAFVGGVLFGWPEARGSRNAYKPRAASREGSLLFCDAATGEVGHVSRARNAEGLIGVVDELEFMTSRDGGQAAPRMQAAPAQSYAPAPAAAPAIDTSVYDDDIPF